MKLSVIIPVYNSANTLVPLIRGLEKALAELFTLEVVLVNDGSTNDLSAKICEELANENPWVIFLNLSRNFGEHNAVMAGLAHCTGEAGVIIDDDLQHPPTEVVKLVHKLGEGYDVVFSRFSEKSHHFLRNLGSRFNNMIATIMLRKPSELYLSSFKAINRFLIDEIVKYRGPYPYIDGLILRVTHNYATVLVEHKKRQEGESGYTIRKLVALWANMFINFSILPLRLAIGMGFLFSIIGLIGSVVFCIEKYLDPDLPMGWASTIVFLLVFSGVQLIGIGMIGEYLGRLFLKDSGNPQYVVRNSVNCVRKKE